MPTPPGLRPENRHMKALPTIAPNTIFYSTGEPGRSSCSCIDSRPLAAVPWDEPCREKTSTGRRHPNFCFSRSAPVTRSNALNDGDRIVAAASREASPRCESKVRDTVLVVEDEVLVRMLVADELRNAGYTVIEASNAHEAVDLLRSSADVTLIFSDVRMPGTMDGVGLARIVRSEFPMIKIVLTSANLTRLDWAGHDGFFPKPYDAVEIIKHIKTLLD
jgi:CheY-like chemotaxis protein